MCSQICSNVLLFPPCSNSPPLYLQQERYITVTLNADVTFAPNEKQ